MKRSLQHILISIADVIYLLFVHLQWVLLRKRKNSVLFLMLLISNLVSAQTINNPDFETWVSTTKVQPQGWHDNNIYLPTPLIVVSKVPGITGSAVRLETKATGFIPTSGTLYNYGTSLYDGGARYTGSGVPKRFKGHCRYNIALDSAVMYLVFKKNGTILSSDTFYVAAGNQPAFTTFDFAISSALTVVPDTVAFYVTGATFNFTNFTTNAKAGDFLELDELSFANGSNVYPFPNGDFDNWPTITEETPDKWQWSGAVTKTTDKQSGSFAVKLVTQDNGAGVEEATLYGSTITLSGGVDTLFGYYKYTGAGGDKGYIDITFWDHSGTGASENKGFTLPAVTTYTQFYIPLVNSINASDFNFYISSSYSNPPANSSTLFIDNLQVKKGKTTGIADPGATSGTCTVYPNPASGIIRVSLTAVSGTKDATLTMHNNLGQVVWNGKVDDNGIDVRNWQSGLYYCTVVNGGDVYHQRIQIVH